MHQAGVVGDGEARQRQQVEKILEKVEQLKDKTMYQEDLTVELARHLCVKVTTIGYHSGVKSEVIVNG